jgi:FkbM family methyltransferase
MLPRVNITRATDADYLTFSTDDLITRELYAKGVWGKGLIDIAGMFCADIDAPFIIDVGANFGGFAVPMAKRIGGRQGLVYAYEPQRVVCYQLCGNAVLNRLDNLHAFNVAIGDTDGEILLPAIDYERSGNIGAFSLEPSLRRIMGAVATDDHAPSSPVTIQRLDSLEFPKAPDLIKIDVEGFELKVLRGADTLLKNANFPPLLLEAWTAGWFADQRRALVDHLTVLGYSNRFERGDELIAQHPDHPRQFTFAIEPTSQAVSMSRAR